jgi:hypothetical protein
MVEFLSMAIIVPFVVIIWVLVVVVCRLAYKDFFRD